VPYPDVFPSVDILYEWLGWDTKVFVTTKDLLVVGATMPLMIVLQYFVTRTGWGRAMRATAQDRETAESMGINVEKTILLTFFIGGALAGAGGIIQGLYYNIGTYYIGYQAGLRAFTAAVLGGIGNMPGAALGGIVIGFLSAWSDQYISARWTNAIVFAILILVLVFRPQGLLGERTPEKV
jgi:branched-chain amino acid transport system permease protein